MSDQANYQDRIDRVRKEMARKSIDAILITPGSDLLYLTGYNAIPLERITALAITQNRDPFLVVPRLERSTALASPFGRTGWEVVAWSENDDPYVLISGRLGNATTSIAVDSHMWAERVFALQSRFPSTQFSVASPLISEIRMRKTPAELVALREAASAIDRVHAAVPSLLRVGRTEREVGRDIGELILAEGHERVDFIIVAAGPNSASPHHELSDRVIQSGEAVVVDIGGTMPSGYCSDCTRTYFMGEPDSLYSDRYQVLRQAQELSSKSVRPGAKSHDIDAAGRNKLAEHGLAEYFIHRTGHGIGLDTHEEPYIGVDNETVIEENMVFSVEPGFYVEGVHGARIEDIVVCTSSGYESLNNQPRDLLIIEG